jgi:lipoprotein-releasing system permease protein
VPLRFARNLLEYDSSIVSSLEINLAPGANEEQVQQQIAQLAGNRYAVKNRFEQHELMNRVMKSEKWAVYFILTLILIIATFNIVGSLTMLIIDKQKDIAVLHSMGADRTMISRIFLSEGVLITLAGAFIGLLLGAALCIGQQRFGFVRLEGEGSFVVDAYPVSMHALDFLYVFLTVFSIGFFAAWYPAKKLVEKKLNLRLTVYE